MKTFLEGAGTYFPPDKGWTIVSVSPKEIELRDISKGSPIRCIDYRYGIMPDESYNADSVPRSPAWLGALDGISAFLDGTPEERHQKAAKLVIETGFIPADHGDIVQGDIDGCAFRKALQAGKIPDLNTLTSEEIRVLRSKIGVHHVTLNQTSRHPEGFLLNPFRFTTVLPNNAQFYPIDIWYPDYLGIEPERFLPVIATCGQLLLPAESKMLYIVLE